MGVYNGCFAVAAGNVVCLRLWVFVRVCVFVCVSGSGAELNQSLRLTMIYFSAGG